MSTTNANQNELSTIYELKSFSIKPYKPNLQSYIVTKTTLINLTKMNKNTN